MKRRDRDYILRCYRCGTGTEFDRVTHACGCVHQYCMECLRDDFSSWDFPADKIALTRHWIWAHARQHLFDGGAYASSKMTPIIHVLWDTKTEFVRASGNLETTWPWSEHSPNVGPRESCTTNSVYSVSWLVRCPVLPEERNGRILARLQDGSMPAPAFKRVRLAVVPLDLFCTTPENRP